MERFDAIVIGMGPAGEHAALRLMAAGKRVAVVERRLIGGECGYYACVPSKVLLRAIEAREQAARTPGLSTPELDWPALRAQRDAMIRDLDDSSRVDDYGRDGATVVKAEGRIVGPGKVAAGDQILEADHIILATGSSPHIPDIEGLDQVPLWTNREVTTLSEIPGTAMVLGGSAVAVELGQFLARMGTKVTLVGRAQRLLKREEPQVSELARQVLQDAGVEVLTGRTVLRSRKEDGQALVELNDGSTVTAEVVVLGTGRNRDIDGLGLESVWVAGGLSVDDQCRVADGVWAIGDLAGGPMFTHAAMYQARIVVDTILGKERRVDYRAIPRVVFGDPEIAAVGLTAAEASAQGIDVATVDLDLTKVIAKPLVYEAEPRGHLGVVADRERGVLVGAWAVAPLASEWIHYAVLAIKAEVPISVLTDTVGQFPSYTEGYRAALEQLDLS